METVTDRPGARKPLALLPLPVLAVLANPVGRVVEHFHVSAAVAGAAVTAIVGGGWEVALVFPWIIPAEATVAGLVAVMGTAAAIAW
ncbi:hypothetical protein ACPXB5_01370 [Micromonospora arida]|uniref:Uncharacterized protein n=1 Tax=Micromonospora arida TaxID=2203715 RepID=A0A3N9XD20_9ACTN|nr:hypothetical protein [Micromonospora arida]RQX10891.1 hypothetical protein DLJ58_10260 [Micromonospora arida]